MGDFGKVAVGFICGFITGGAAGALYATNLYDKKPSDLVEAQKIKNEEWKNSAHEFFKGLTSSKNEEEKEEKKVEDAAVVEKVEGEVVSA